MPLATSVEMRAEATKIVEEFLQPDAPSALNLASEFLLPYKNGTPEVITANMFDGAVRVIYKAIEHDTFLRFKHTGAAEELLAKFPDITKETNTSNKRLSDASLVSFVTGDHGQPKGDAGPAA